MLYQLVEISKTIVQTALYVYIDWIHGLTTILPISYISVFIRCYSQLFYQTVFNLFLCLYTKVWLNIIN